MDQKPPVDLEQEHQSHPPEEQHHHEAQQKQRSTPPAAKVARLVSPRRGEAGTVTMATPSSPLVALGLHLGQHGAAGDVARLPAFTFMQRQDQLEHQAVIYKYMAAGLPVPVHLVLPIWKSVVASSLGPRHFPTLMSYYGSLCLDYRNYMEPEPGRCRRTDGKKWRCSRDVVVDHKYCERHMHRGRNRSRKPVEAAAAAAADATAPRGAATSSAKAASTAATGVSPPA